MPKPEACRFLQSHEWVAVEGDTATVGVSDHAQHEISDVVFVELPKVGRVLKQKETCSVIESVKAAFDIYAPIGGTVTAVNAALVQDPALVNRSAQEEGWLFKLKVSDAKELDKLMDWKAYQEFIKSGAASGGH